MRTGRTCLFFRRKPSLSFHEMNTCHYTHSDSPSLALSPPMLIASFSTRKQNIFMNKDRITKRESFSLNRNPRPNSRTIWSTKFCRASLALPTVVLRFLRCFAPWQRNWKNCFWPFFTINLSLIEDFTGATVPSALEVQSTSMSMRVRKLSWQIRSVWFETCSQLRRFSIEYECQIRYYCVTSVHWCLYSRFTSINILNCLPCGCLSSIVFTWGLWWEFQVTIAVPNMTRTMNTVHMIFTFVPQKGASPCTLSICIIKYHMIGHNFNCLLSFVRLPGQNRLCLWLFLLLLIACYHASQFHSVFLIVVNSLLGWLYHTTLFAISKCFE